MDADGRFSVALPNFAWDVVVGSFKRPGDFAFRLRDPTTGDRFELKAAGSNSLVRGRVPVADSYHSEQMFDVELSR
jgi:hypothetical protein